MPNADANIIQQVEIGAMKGYMKRVKITLLPKGETDAREMRELFGTMNRRGVVLAGEFLDGEGAVVVELGFMPHIPVETETNTAAKWE